MNFHWTILLLTSLLAPSTYALTGIECSSLADDPRTYSERVTRMSLPELEREGEKELGLNQTEIRHLVSKMIFDNARGAASEGVFKSIYQGKVYFIKSLGIRFDFHAERFRRQAAAAIVLGHSELGPKAGVLSKIENNKVLIIMEELPGVPMDSKFWDFNGVDVRDREKGQRLLLSQIETELGTKFETFQEAKATWLAALRASPRIRNSLDALEKRVVEFGIHGADFETRISISAPRPIGIIDTTVVWVDHNETEENGILTEFQYLRRLLR